ncbi:MAG: winged helix-turn-helix domain-containing protein [Thermoanaerobaculia bacterium]
MVSLTPKAFDLLVALVSRGGRLARREELLAELWPDAVVEDGTLSRHFSTLRRALGSDADGLLETVPRAGYRFRGAVDLEPVTDGPGAPLLPVASEFDAKPARTTPQVTSRRRTLLTLLVLLGIATAWWALPLRRTPSTAAAAQNPHSGSLAVLPFLPLTPGESDLYACVGLADTLIARLSRLPDLAIRPVSAVRDFTEPGRDPLAVGRQLQVDTVLDGTLRTTESEIRVTARLLRVADGVALWTDSFEFPGGELSRVEEVIARKTVVALAPALAASTPDLVSVPSVTPESHDRYLRGRFFLGKRSLEGQDKAVVLFREALLLDPGSAEAEAGLASALVLRANYSEPADLALEARQHALRALELEPRSADAHAVLGLVAMNRDRDWALAEREFRKALALQPNHLAAHHWLGEMLALLGRTEEGLSFLARARAFDPLSLPVASDQAKALYFAQRYPEAIVAADAVLEMDSSFSWALAWRGLARLELGDCPAAIDDLEQFAKLESTPLSQGWLGLVVGRCGDTRRAREIAQDLERRSRTEFVLNAPLAAALLGAEDRQGALAALERAARKREIVLGWSTAPGLAALRGESRFDRLIRSVGLPALP